MDTDVSDVWLGAILLQILQGTIELLEQIMLLKLERIYCVTRREMLAVRKGVENFYKYLSGKKFLL